MSDPPPPGWTPPQEPPPEQPPTWPPPPPPQQPPTWPPQQQPPPPPPGATQQWGPPPAAGGYQQYGYPGYAAPKNTEGNAIAALVLGIASYPLAFACGLGLITAILSLIFAHIAKRNIDASGGAVDGLGMVTAARIMSWIFIGLAVVGVILFIIVAAAGGFDESSTYDSLGALASTIA